MMEKLPEISTEEDLPIRRQEGEEGAGVEDGEGAHREAVLFVEKYRDFFEHYARGRVKFEPAPPELNTFAFDPETNTIFVNSRFYTSQGFSEEKTAFAILHEIEHMLEKTAWLETENGEKSFEKYLDKIKTSDGYSLMDNCVADLRENRSVLKRTNKKWREIEKDAYENDLFKEKDFREEPQHVQFCYGLLREGRLPDEKCELSPDVRQKLDEFYEIRNKRGGRLIDVMTDPSVPMSLRASLQDEYIYPIVEELLKKDIENEKKKKEEQKQGEGDGKSGQDKKPGDKKGGEKSKENQKGSGEPEDSDGDEEGDPNKIFKDAYDRAKKRMPHVLPEDVDDKILEEKKKNNKEGEIQKADKEYADKLGVKKEDLQNYRNLVKKLENIKNPETQVSVIEEIRNIIRRIIAERRKEALAPRYPMEEGEELVDPSELVAQFKVGNLEPKVWESHEIKEQKGKKFGEVEITLICDRSGSMAQEGKLREQQNAAVLLMEALKEFADMADEEVLNLTKPLEIRSEIYAFAATSGDSKPLKKMSKELGEKDRIEITATLSTAPGQSTTDFVPLEQISKSISQEILQKIKEGELKKIVIVFTDGGSDDPARVQRILTILREQGVVVIGVGVTESGAPAITTYAPDARLAKQAQDLPIVLGELLKKELATINS